MISPPPKCPCPSIDALPVELDTETQELLDAHNSACEALKTSRQQLIETAAEIGGNVATVSVTDIDKAATDLRAECLQIEQARLRLWRRRCELFERMLIDVAADEDRAEKALDSAEKTAARALRRAGHSAEDDVDCHKNPAAAVRRFDYAVQQSADVRGAKNALEIVRQAKVTCQKWRQSNSTAVAEIENSMRDQLISRITMG